MNTPTIVPPLLIKKEHPYSSHHNEFLVTWKYIDYYSKKEEKLRFQAKLGSQDSLYNKALRSYINISAIDSCWSNGKTKVAE